MRRRHITGAVGFVLVSFFAFAALSLVLDPVRESAMLERRTEVRNALFTVRADLEGRLQAALTVTRAVNFAAARPGTLSAARFDALVDYLRADAPFIRHIALSEGTVITRVYPREGNERILGLDMRDLPRQWQDTKRVIATRRPMLVGPVQLVQGGIALIQRSPVFAAGPDGTPGAGAFKGIVSAVMNMDAVFDAATRRIARKNLAIAFRRIPAAPQEAADGGGTAPAPALVWGDAAVFDRDPVTTTVTVPGGQWTLAAVPAQGWPLTPPNWWVLQLMSAVVALVLGAGAYLWVQRRAERRAAERERAAMVARLQRSNQELERFAWAASHELQTPLRQISSYLQLLQRRRNILDGEARDYLAFSITAAQRLSQHVADMVAFTHQPTEQRLLPPVQADMAATRALERFRATLEGIGAEVTLSPLPPVRARPEELVSVFQHLVSNAIQYRAADRPLRLALSGRRRDGMAEIVVADNGPGIAPEHRARVFDVFERLVSPYHSEGTGLGLSICRRIAERSGGRMWITASDSGGCACHILLPLAETAKVEPPATPARTAAVTEDA